MCPPCKKATTEVMAKKMMFMMPKAQQALSMEQGLLLTRS